MATDTTVLVQASTKADIETMSALAHDIWQESYASILSPDQIEYMLMNFQSPRAIEADINDNQTGYYFITHNKKTQGYIAFMPDGDRLFMTKLYLYKSARGLGLGRAALNFLFDIGRKNNYRAVWLKVAKKNSKAQGFYKKIGFTQIAEAKTPIGNGYFMDDYYLEYEL